MDYQNRSREELIAELIELEHKLDASDARLNIESKKLKQAEFELSERTKELLCHNRISEVLSDADLSREEVIEKIVGILPDSMQYPHLTQASVTINDRAFSTPEFKITKHALIQEITVNQKKAGELIICYQDDKILTQEEVFLPEESLLIYTVAVRIGNYIEKYEKTVSLFQSEIKYQNLVETVHDVIYEVNPEGIIRYISPAVEKITAYKPDELIGKDIMTFFHEKDRVLLKEKMTALPEQKDDSYMDCRFITKNNTDCWVRISIHVIIENGKVTGGIGSFTDINVQKLLGVELQRTESLYKSVFAASPDTIVITDLEGRITFVSQKVMDLFGSDNTDIFIGHSILEYVDPADHQRALQNIMKMQQRYLGTEEYLGIRHDGKRIPLELNGDMIRDENGTPIRMVFVVRDISARKSLEEKLILSEEAYRKMVEAINDTIFETDNEGIIKYVSPAIEKMLGYTIEEILGKNFLDYVYPEDRTALMNMRSNVAENGFVVIEYRYMAKDGSIRWVRSSISPLMTNGIMTGRTGSLVDIHERKVAEEKLKASELLYRSILEASPDAIIITNLEGEIQIVSPAGFDMFGVEDQQESLNKSFLNFIAENDRERARINFIRMFKEDFKGVVEYSGLKLDGTLFPFEVNGRFIRDAEGQAVSMVFVTRDISERKLAIEKLHQSESLYSSILNASPDTIVITDMEGTITFASSKIMEMFGYDNTDVFINRNILEFIDKTDQQRAADRIVGMLQGIYIGSTDYKGVRADGSTFDVEVNGQSIKNEAGNPTQMVLVARDVSKRKLLEKKLIKSEETYRNLVERVNDVVFEITVDGIIKYVSPAIERVLGYTAEEVMGKNFFSYMFSEDISLVRKALANLQASDAASLEYRYIKKDGSVHWVQSSTAPVFEDGKLTGGVGILTDINERKLTEEELVVQRNYTESIIRAIPDLLFVLNSEGVILQHKAGRDEDLAMPPELFLNKNIAEVLPESLCVDLMTGIRLIKDGKPADPIHYKMQVGDNLNDYEARLSPFWEDQVIVLVSNISWRIQAEEELRESHRKINVVMNNLRGVVYRCSSDPDWTMEFISDGIFDLVGYPPADFIKNAQRTFNSIIHENDQARIMDEIQKAVSDKKPYTLEYRVITSDTKQKWVWEKGQGVYEGDTLIALEGFITDITEMKRAEEEIKGQNDRLNAIIKTIPDIIFVMDYDGNYLEFYAPEHTELLKPKEDLVGMNIRSVFDEETADLHIRKIQECAQLKNIVTYEYSTVQDNKYRFFEVRIAPMGNNKVLRFVRDFTERRLQNEQILKFSLAVDQSPVSIVITDLKGVIEYVNPAFEKITGYSFAEVMGQRTNMLKSGSTDEEVYKNLWETISNGKIWQGEWIDKKKNGELFWEEVSITPIYNNENRLTNFLAIKQDVTLRKQNEKEIHDLNTNLERKILERTMQLAEANDSLLNEIEDRKQIEAALLVKTTELENFFNVALDLLCIADVSGNFLKVNKAWEDILGYSVAYLESHKFLDFVHPDDIQMTLDSMTRLSEQSPILNFINRYRTIDGSYRFIEWHSVPVGQIIYAAARDITERKRTEDFEFELLQLSSNLTVISTDDINKAINMALERIGKFLHTDRAYIFEINWDNNTMSNTFEWCNEGVMPEINNLKGLPLEAFPEWTATLKRHETINIPSVNKLPGRWDAERNVLEQQGIQSLIVIPMFIEKELIGYVGLDSLSQRSPYSESEINILKVWGSMISSLILKEKTEILLELTRQNYETFFNTVEDFLWVLDKEGNIVYFNKTALVRLGYSMEELVNKSILLVHAPDRQAEAANLLGRLLLGTDEVFSIPLKTKSGKIIPVETRAIQGLWNEQPIIFMISKDISQIKLSEQKFSTAFQSGSALMAISDFDDGIYVDVNNSFIEILGYSREDVIGKTNTDLGIFVDTNLRSEIIKSLEEDKQIRKLEALVRTKEGQIKIILLSADSIYIGEKRCLLTVAVDITDRKTAEEALKQAQMEAEKANVAKSEFLSRMSHELRTPLNSILGFAQLLEMGELSPGQKKGVTHIMHSGRHLLDLINEVLDISRIEAGHLSISLEPVQIDGIVQEMIDTIRPLAVERHLKVEFLDAPDNLLFVRADRQRLRQVLLNLLNNAVKYNRYLGSIIIKTEALPENSENIAFVRISISDTGIGIREEDIPKLFTPFERIGADKTKTEGTGLGLAVVQKLMEAMGGRLGVESVLGEGSTFWIELPRTINLLEALNHSNILNGGQAGLIEKVGTVLYVEDNRPNIELVEQILASQRPSVRLITTVRGLEVLNLASEHRPALILLDLNLPDIHGDEVLQLLQADESTRDIPVVIISADAMPRQRRILLESGAKDYLTKPLDVPLFLKIIDQFIPGFSDK